MPYECKNVKVKCHLCEAIVEGNQRYMLGGKGNPQNRPGSAPKWLKEKPEYSWLWNGLSAEVLGKRVEFDFYLCPKHTSETNYLLAMKWAQEQIDGQKALAKLVVGTDPRLKRSGSR